MVSATILVELCDADNALLMLQLLNAGRVPLAAPMSPPLIRYLLHLPVSWGASGSIHFLKFVFGNGCSLYSD